jgi:hypothetical protein
MIFREHGMVLKNHVNPIYIKGMERIHTICGSPSAIPSNRDLL